MDDIYEENVNEWEPLCEEEELIEEEIFDDWNESENLEVIIKDKETRWKECGSNANLRNFGTS